MVDRATQETGLNVMTPGGTPRWRRWLFRVLTTLYILFWLNVAFSADTTDLTHRIQEFAYRMLFGLVLIVIPAVVQLRRPENNVAAQQ